MTILAMTLEDMNNELDTMPNFFDLASDLQKVQDAIDSLPETEILIGQ